jgi:hypothetical protein
MREIMATTMRMESMKTLCGVPFKERTLTELDVSGKNLGTEGALVVAEYLDGNGALSSVNVLSNVIPVEQAQELVQIMRSKDTLTTLCGLTGEETELDFSNGILGAGDAVLIANDISDMGAISSLNLSSNNLGQLPLGWAAHVDPASQKTFYAKEGETSQWVHPGGIGFIADAINDMGATTSLNLALNDLGAQGAKSIAACLPKCT